MQRTQRCDTYGKSTSQNRTLIQRKNRAKKIITIKVRKKRSRCRFLLLVMLSVQAQSMGWARSHIVTSFISMNTFISLLSKNLYLTIGYDGKVRCRHECVNRIATSHLASTFTLQSMCCTPCTQLRHINGIVNIFFFQFLFSALVFSFSPAMESIVFFLPRFN